MKFFEIKPYRDVLPKVTSGHIFGERGKFLNFNIDGKPYHCLNRHFSRFTDSNPDDTDTQEWDEDYTHPLFYDSVGEVRANYPDADIVFLED